MLKAQNSVLSENMNFITNKKNMLEKQNLIIKKELDNSNGIFLAS